MERTCKKCGETKPIEEFTKNKRCKYGHSFECKKCTNKDSKKYGKKYREVNKEKISARKKAEYQNNKDYIKKHVREYYENHKDYYKEYDKEYANNNKEKYRKIKEKYRKNNKDICLKASRDWARKNQDETYKREVINLSDNYIMTKITDRQGVSRKTLRQHPELIESYRQQIKIKRLLKSKKNENTETS